MIPILVDILICGRLYPSLSFVSLTHPWFLLAIACRVWLLTVPRCLLGYPLVILACCFDIFSAFIYRILQSGLFCVAYCQRFLDSMTEVCYIYCM